MKKKIQFSRQNIQNFHQFFFCEFRTKVPSKNQLLRSRSVCGSELSQCWACAERGEKWVSDLRAWEKKPAWEKGTNKTCDFLNFNWVLARERSVRSWSENQKVQPRHVSWNSWAKLTLSWSWRIIEKRVIACLLSSFCLSENFARSIWLRANLKERKRKWEFLRTKIEIDKIVIMNYFLSLSQVHCWPRSWRFERKSKFILNSLSIFMNLFLRCPVVSYLKTWLKISFTAYVG